MNICNWSIIHIYITPLERLKTDDKRELKQLEDTYIKNHINNKYCLNIKRVQLTDEEKKQKRAEIRRRCIKKHEQYYKNYLQEYYKKNRDHIKDHNNKHYHATKDRDHIILCTCGTKINKYYATKHKQTTKHKKLMDPEDGQTN